MALKTFKPTTPSQRQLVLVDRSELHRGKPVKGLVEGKYDHLPEAAFYMVGSIEEAVEKAQRLAAEAA